ncbi:serine hydrolase [Zeaxanthinibacter sp. PT1]|uniref:serine hydrolase domain-containing protein n=1 Tax=Zeaxanthinibacter TaxID=561554 RepID=UPI00234BDA8C|nr:serine hydrolase domain-containing protein [Zeaxanthinibacter sp. PT1]MDC6350111.1 serine hydrolase [Zeaxanthinibacter sp. PT1]
MMRPLFIVALLMLNSCAESPANARQQSSSTDIHLEKIEMNLPPVHYLEGQAQMQTIPQAMGRYQVAGVSMAFVNKGKLQWTKSYGYASLEDSTLISPATVFAGGSLSKPITAIAALSMVEGGLMPLDENVNTILKDYQLPENSYTVKEKITLRRLITHKAGIKNELWASYFPNEAVPSLTAMLSGTPPSMNQPVEVIAVPGSREQYSNPGYSVIQKILEDVSGQSFDDIIQERIFSAAGMSSSTMQQPIPESLAQKRATGYDKDGLPYPYKLFPFKAAGGIWTTPEDMAKFMIAIMDDYHKDSRKLLSRKMAKTVFDSSTGRLGFTKEIKDDQILFDHWGSNAGFSCYMVGHLDKEQGVVIMTNSDRGFDLLAAIARSVAMEYQWGFLEPEIYNPIEIQAGVLKDYTGTFSDKKPGGMHMEFQMRNSALYISTASQDHKLIPVTNSKFISAEDNHAYEFIRDENNVIKWVRITEENGYNFDLLKETD